jgi:hypothetical protein
MIDIHTEKLQTLTEAARLLPDRPHVSTLYRWAQRGVKGVRLETVVVGGRRYTSVEALQRFAQRLTADPSPPVPTKAKGMSPHSAQVERELEALGL